MISSVQTMYSACRKVLAERTYFLIFIITAIIFLGLFILIPLLTIPGNDLAFQLTIFRTRDYALMTFLAVLAGLNFAFRMYNLQGLKEKKQFSYAVTKSASSGMFGIFGAMVGTAACASCFASLFGLIGLGTGSVFFVLKNQAYFLIGAIALMLVSLYFAARKACPTVPPWRD